jgi:hypothetical protein
MMKLGALRDRLMGLTVLAVMVGLVGFIYLFGGVLGLDVIAVVVGIAGGLISVVALYGYFNQEKTLYFPEDEKVLLKSSGGGTHVVFVNIGEQYFPLNPIRADLYLTNIGVLAEPPGSGESILYIPHHRITDLVPYMENGLKVRYFDVNDQFSEVVLYLENRDRWHNKHLSILGRSPNL